MTQPAAPLAEDFFVSFRLQFANQTLLCEYRIRVSDFLKKDHRNVNGKFLDRLINETAARMAAQ